MEVESRLVLKLADFGRPAMNVLAAFPQIRKLEFAFTCHFIGYLTII